MAATDWRHGRELALVPTRANSQPAYSCYLTGLDEPIARPIGLVVLTPTGDRVRGIARFLDDDLPLRFGLPRKIDSTVGTGR